MENPERPPSSDMVSGHNTGTLEEAARLNKKYVSWDVLRTRDLNHDAVDVWRIMSSLRRSTADTVRVGDVQFSWNITPDMIADMHNIDMHHKPGLLFGHRLNRHSRKMYMVSSTMEEAIASALLSGCMVKAKNAKKMLREKREPRTNSEGAVQRVYSCIEFARARGTEQMTPELMKEINHMASGDGFGVRQTEQADRSQYSKDPLLNPISVRKVDRAISDLCKFAGNEDVHPLIRAFGLEYMIHRVQPFANSNGRTARAVATWCLAKCGYEVDGYLSISGSMRSHLTPYQRAFLTSEAENDDMTYAISFCLGSMCDAITNFITYLNRKSFEQEDFLAGISMNNLNSRQRAILSDMSKSGTPVTVEEIAAKHQVSYQTARTDLLLLAARGLVEKSGRDGHKDTYKRSENYNETL